MRGSFSVGLPDFDDDFCRKSGICAKYIDIGVIDEYNGMVCEKSFLHNSDGKRRIGKWWRRRTRMRGIGNA